MNRRTFLVSSSALTASFSFRGIATQTATSTEVSVLSSGARGDGSSLDTRAFQKAIDTVSTSGGGRVIVPGGKRYLIGAILFRDNVNLCLADDAVLLASPDQEHYKLPGSMGLINAHTASNVRITGTGHVDGQAMKFMENYSPVHER